MNAHGKNGARAWFELLRVPNLFTVPGDALAGFALAWPMHKGGFSALLAAVLVSVLFYSAGILLNDVADAARDRKERPSRPIPSGRVSVPAARYATGGCLAAALFVLGAQNAGMLLAGIVLGGLIFAYNLFARRNRLAGVMVMGLCRAASVGLGVAAGAVDAFTQFATIGVMAWWTAYIAAVSWLASREMEEGAYGIERWIPMGIIIGGAAMLVMQADTVDAQMKMRAFLAFMFSALIAWQCAVRLRMKAARHHAPMIGWLISAIIPMQAGVLVLFSREPWFLLVALLVLFCWPLNRWLAKSFAPS